MKFTGYFIVERMIKYSSADVRKHKPFCKLSKNKL